MVPTEVITRIRALKRRQMKAMEDMEALVEEARKEIKRGALSVKALAQEGELQTAWLLREARLVPNLHEGLRRARRATA